MILLQLPRHCRNARRQPRTLRANSQVSGRLSILYCRAFDGDDDKNRQIVSAFLESLLHLDCWWWFDMAAKSFAHRREDFLGEGVLQA